MSNIDHAHYRLVMARVEYAMKDLTRAERLCMLPELFFRLIADLPQDLQDQFTSQFSKDVKDFANTYQLVETKGNA